VSVNSDIYVRLVYDDEAAAVGWLTRVFGFEERERKENPGGSAIVWLGHPEADGVVMVSRSGYGLESPRTLGGSSQKVNVYLRDVDRHYEQATREGATIERPLETVPYGERRYEAFDCEGHRWHFTQRL
jgi:uncharacterized glyoxalase superfamily protein PhnB